jgi:hypothetical protein
MSTTPPDLESLERGALEHLAEEEGRVEADLEAAAAVAEAEAEAEEAERTPLRLAAAVAFPTLAAAVMAGGVFLGSSARVYAAVAGILGVALAVAAARLRSPLATNAAVVVGLFAIGLLMVAPAGMGQVAAVRKLAAQAAASGDVLRPPVELTAGWQAILGWLLGIVGFAAAWVAVVLKRPSLGLLLPLPVAAVAGISVPDADQVASGIMVLVLFAIGLGLLSGVSSGEAEERLPVGYEVRRALRAVPLLAVVTVGLYLLAQTNFLFPKPYIDPAQEPQKPKTVPLSEVEDRVLFSVEAQISGPWRLGSIDTYDGKDWRLPAFSESELANVPRSGVVNPELRPGVKATFTVAGLGGTVLPGLPNTVGIVAEGPRLAYDSRSGNIRVAQGQIQAGLRYSVAAAALPTVEDLRLVTATIPKSLGKFLDIPSPPPAVVDLLAKAPKANKWDEFDFLRNWILTNVTATGTGVPKSVTPERVNDMIAGSKEGSPFEIVAAQAMLARWAGLPSRIGYGFDGGEQVEGKLEVRPRNGASFPEVYFPGFEWLPVIGTPVKAKATVGSDPTNQRQDPAVLPSDDISIQLFLPVVIPPQSVFYEQLRRGVLIAIPVLALLGLTWATFPALRKAWARSRRRTAARAAGARARIALAYADWRDACTDFGYRHDTDTPLMFLDRFSPDDEHAELAWLVTRSLWGDLAGSVTEEMATAAEELSRALRRRLAQAHPAPVKAIALVSRLSLRHPFAPDLAHSFKEARRDAA